MAEEKSIDTCYQFTRDTRSYIEAVEKRHDREISEVKTNFKDDIGAVNVDIKSLVDKMINRLPPWATAVIFVLAMAVGVLAGMVK